VETLAHVVHCGVTYLTALLLILAYAVLPTDNCKLFDEVANSVTDLTRFEILIAVSKSNKVLLDVSSCRLVNAGLPTFAKSVLLTRS
jgi:hypothetical protein